MKIPAKYALNMVDRRQYNLRKEDRHRPEALMTETDYIFRLLVNNRDHKQYAADMLYRIDTVEDQAGRLIKIGASLLDLDARVVPDYYGNFSMNPEGFVLGHHNGHLRESGYVSGDINELDLVISGLMSRRDLVFDV